MQDASELVLGPWRLADAPDVVHASRERVFAANERLRENAELEMLFEHGFGTVAQTH